MPGQTAAEKIISRHAGKSVFADELVIVDVDGVMASDTTAPLAIRAFHEMGGRDLWDAKRVFLVIDHAAPAPSERIADLHLLMRDFAGKSGAVLYDVGEGICHQLMIEQGHVRTGDLFLGADSHTCTYGSIGAFSSGVGSTDLAAVMLTGKTWLKVPKTIRVDINGKLPAETSAKDVVLHLAGLLGASGATYQAIEFHGETCAAMSLDSRMTIANMVVEMGAKAGIINPEGLPDLDPERFEMVQADADAVYSETIEIEAGSLRSQIAQPHSPDHVAPVDELKGTPINCGFIGTCVNGRLEDLAVAAEVLNGKTLAPGVRLIVSPASRKVFLDALELGVIGKLTRAGATFIPPGCGPCVGTHNGVPGKGEVVISTANRNFQGRMGNPNASIYLASPRVVAASVIAGEITDQVRDEVRRDAEENQG